MQDGKRIALVSISFDIYSLTNRALKLHKSIKASAVINDDTVEGILAAMSSAVQSVFDELAKELLAL